MTRAPYQYEAVCRLECGDSVTALQRGDHGTAFLIAPNMAFTVAHAIEKHLSDEQNNITLVFTKLEEPERKAYVKLIDEENDIALLELSQPVTGIEYLSLAWGDIQHDDYFETYGYPNCQYNDGRRYTGTVNTFYLSPTVENYDLDLALSTPVTHTHDLHGLSGSPILMNGDRVVVGIVRRELTTGTIGAISVMKFAKFLEDNGVDYEKERELKLKEPVSVAVGGSMHTNPHDFLVPTDNSKATQVETVSLLQQPLTKEREGVAKWTASGIDRIAGGELLEQWLEQARVGLDSNLLFICGAGVSLSGKASARLSHQVGQHLETVLLNSRDAMLPEYQRSSGNIASLYEAYCYQKVNGQVVFDPNNHDHFIKQVIQSGGDFYFEGNPNFAARGLERDVFTMPNRSIRIYSLNVNQFFSNAITQRLSIRPSTQNVINAAVLGGKQKGSHEHRNWEVLAAHGILNQGSTVWSERLLVNPLQAQNDAWDAERAVLHSAVDCIECGPIFKRVVFVGVCAPLLYLLDPLCQQIAQQGFEWMWINPFDPPQAWLLNAQNHFNQANGIWVEDDFNEVMIHAHLERFQRWLHKSAVTPTMITDQIQIVGNKRVVEGLHRARRIHSECTSLMEDSRSLWKIDSYHKCVDVYDPPMLQGVSYADATLAVTLQHLHEHQVKLTDDPGDGYPLCTVATLNSKKPISVQILSIQQVSIYLSPDQLVDGVLSMMDGRRFDPDLLHLLVLDCPDYFLHAVAKNLQNKIKIRYFAKTSIKLEVITPNELGSKIKSIVDGHQTSERRSKP